MVRITSLINDKSYSIVLMKGHSCLIFAITLLSIWYRTSVPTDLHQQMNSYRVSYVSIAKYTHLATKSLYSLLQIFQEGKLEDFQSFLSTSESTLSKYNLSKDECIRHMRLLSLCSLAAEHEEIPYDAIATTLQVPSEEVESWVITAVSSGLLSAKMDQLQHVVMVERSAVRKFDLEEWKILKERLDVWKKNVKGVLDGLKQSQISQQ